MNRSRRMFRAGATIAIPAATFLFASGGVANADPTLGSAASRIEFSFNSGDYGFQEYGGGNFSYAYGGESGATQGEPAPEAMASVVGSGGGAGSDNFVMTTLQYYFEVTGPTPTVEIDVNGINSFSASYTGGTDSIAWVQSNGVIEETGANGTFGATVATFGNNYLASCPSNINCSGGPAYSYPGPYTQTSMIADVQVYAIQLQIYASVFNSGTASGTFDPVISIDPSVPDAGAYQIFTSAGIENSPPTTVGSVPEPSTWTLLIAGFCVAAPFWRWRRRASPA